MAASHHDREEETLIAYFQQMLAEVDDNEFDGELQAQDGSMQAAPAAQSSYSAEANHQVLQSANQAIAAEHSPATADTAIAAVTAAADTDVSAVAGKSADTDEQSIANPSGGFEHISTNDMLAHEMAMVAEEMVVDHLINSENPATYDARNTQDYQQEQAASESYGYGANLYGSGSGEELAPELQPQEQTQEQSATAVEYAQPNDSLQRLLATIDTSTETETEIKVAEPEVKVETKVAEPEVKVETKVAEPEVKVETKVAEPEVKVETKVAEPEVKVETKVAEPEVKVETKVAEPEVKVEAQVAVAPAPVVTPVQTTVQTKQEVKTPAQLAQERMAANLHQIAAKWENVDLGEQFQVLFFLVQGVRFAVPLIDLGGIFECDKITQLFGKPSWFMGITDIRGAKINIVDTLRWVMPEIGDSPDKYPYLIALGKSQWSIGCDVLEGNRTLQKSQIKWREIPGSRPWLAGIVTSEKCALLHVNALIALFEAGADIEDLNRDFEQQEKQKEKEREKAQLNGAVKA